MTDGRTSAPFDSAALSNANSIWGALTLEVLVRLGVQLAVVSPGARSAPLAFAAARNPGIEAIPVLDERSAAFFALGHAKRTGRPSVLIATSGTAAANYYPAVIEASMSGTPLLVLTADRPPELRECAAGQTIDQQKLYGGFPRWFQELALPEATPRMLAYLRQTLVHAVDRSLVNNPGPVHLNFPFREPLAPEPRRPNLLEAHTLEAAATVLTRSCEAVVARSALDSVAVERLASHRKGLILVGDVSDAENPDFAQAVATLAGSLGWPVAADVLGSLRGHASRIPGLLSRYDAFLRDDKKAADLEPSAILQIGPPPTSKILRQRLGEWDAATFLLRPRPANTDPVHRVAAVLHGEAADLAKQIPPQSPDSDWKQLWLTAENEANRHLDPALESMDALFEGKAAWLLSRHLPARTPVFLAGSMSVRYAEFFWSSGDGAHPIYANRGANGIDGTLGTALGLAHRNRPAVLLTGDLAFLHDSNALLAQNHFHGALTIVLIQNQGGGIFEHLPLAETEPGFEDFFATPQEIHMDRLCRAHRIPHQNPVTWENFVEAIRTPHTEGLRVIEIQTDRKADPPRLRDLFSFL